MEAVSPTSTLSIFMKIQKQQNNLKYEYIEYILPAVCLCGV